jgi:hypothetical protein
MRCFFLVHLLRRLYNEFMNSERPLTPSQRHFLVVFLGGLPAFCVGFVFGIQASIVGSQRDPDAVSILFRALICAVPPSLLALSVRRFWWLPSLIYGWGFYGGYFFNDSFNEGLAGLATSPYIPFAALVGLPTGRFSPPAHFELIWIFAFALWLTAFMAFIRRHYLQDKSSN